MVHRSCIGRTQTGIVTMRSIAGWALSLALVTSNPVLAKCRSACHADECARAVTGTGLGPVFISQAKSDCSSFVVTTSYGHTMYGGLQTLLELVEVFANSRCSTLTAPITSIGETTIPTYASACSGSAGYASACSCYGITSHVVTRTHEVWTSQLGYLGGALSAKTVVYRQQP